jgi:hypothetical protein
MHLLGEGRSHEVEDRSLLGPSYSRVEEHRHVLQICLNQDYPVSCDV